MVSQKRLVGEQKKEVFLLLHNIRSTYNVGAIFRTADATNVSKIYISGYTPAPIDRFGRARKDISKASLGAESTVAWENVTDISDLIKKLKKEKVRIVGLEQDKRSIDFRKISKKGKILVILGNEVGGIEKEVLDQCDEIIEIPMLGEKESLNVSVATGVILYQLI